MSDTVTLVREAIAASELSAVKFGSHLVWRDGRTVRRWLAGGPVPRGVVRRLEWFLALSHPQRRLVVAAAFLAPEPRDNG